MHDYQKKAGNDGCKKISVGKIPFNFHFMFSSKDSDQRNVAQVINRPTGAKASNSRRDFGLVKKGEITPAVNQAAATVLAKSERALSWVGLRLPIFLMIKCFLGCCQVS